MQDYIPRGIDINGTIDTVEVRQYDNNSRFIRVKLRDDDLAEDNNTFDLSDCTTALYIRPESGGDVSFISGTVESPSGVVTFLIPGGVTQVVGNYLCQIRIYEGDETDRPVISSKPFKLTVDESIADDAAIEATPDYSALTATMTNYQAVKNQMAALVASPAGSGGDVGTEVRDARIGWDGTEYDSLGDAVRGVGETGLVYLGTLLNSSTWSAYKSGDTMSFDALPNNIFAVCNVTEAVNPIDNAPVSGPMSGLILTFGRGNKMSHKNFDTQIFIPQSRERLYVRKYDGSAWSSWGTLTDYLPQYRAGINNLYASYNYRLSNVKDDGTFHVSQQDTSGGSIVQRWSDLPDSESNFIVTNAGYSAGWILQTATATNTYTDIYRRIIPRAGVTGTPSNWVKLGYLDPRLKVLAIGDSICADTRNNKRGYVKPLGVQSRNAGESGASLAIIESRAGYWVIPERFIKFFNDHSKNVNESNDGWEPDVILANGGRNDYNFDAPLGDIPTAPSLNDDGTPDYSSLDLSTAMGGLQKLFLLMIEKYPKAQRYFVTTHKIYRTADNEHEPQKNGYAPSRLNREGKEDRYTATDLNDAIIACCKVYGVKVIDIFNESMLDSAFAPYRYNANATDNYFDADGVHPLERGYLEGYVPLIREAIRTGTVKN